MSSLNSAQIAPITRSSPFHARGDARPVECGYRSTPSSGRSRGTTVDHNEWAQPLSPGGSPEASLIQVSRWKNENPDGCERLSPGDADLIDIAIALRPTNVRLEVSGRCMHDGKVLPGVLIVTPAGHAVRAIFRTPCDVLHLKVPIGRFHEMWRQSGKSPSSPVLQQIGVAAADPTIERLAWLFLKAGDFYGDGVAAAIIARMLDTADEQLGTGGRSQGLVKWRLRRVESLIDADVSEPLSLADLARCAGLSRMHFAAQFRTATGMRPHEYVVHRRIQRALEILRTSTMPLAEVALAVGFQTQAHFTTVFRRLISETPGRWRQLHQATAVEFAEA
jgi:AraC family transcriptional regulator